MGPLEIYLKFNFLSNALNLRALAPILTELWPFSHANFLKREFFGFFSSCRPPYKRQIVKISKIYCLYSKMWVCTSRKLQKNCTWVPYKVLKMIGIRPYP